MKQIKLFLFFIITSIISSCSNEELYVGDTKIFSQNNAAILSSVPFADEQTLTEIASIPDNVPYSTAHKLAMIEMELGLNESMNWHGAKLSEKGEMTLYHLIFGW
jgi:hypothetical protein